ncbi:MAG: alpha/beta hydrolase [Alphaproteobacteria bacterium]|nr:alpha/beta hydrolase [Alphaproteobacteria bacterium]
MREGSFAAPGPGETVRLAYTEWGSADNPQVVLCVHGLTRNARDFDELAATLGERYRVICPDVAGRGKSAWFTNKALYANPVYADQMVQLIAHLGVSQVDWIGTSMGGIVGMMVAARPDTPVRRLVINDVGPFIPKEALTRLGHYVGKRPSFPTLEAAADYVAEVMAGFGRLTRAQWLHLARTSYRTGANGMLELIYDPDAVAALLSGPQKDVAFWPVWMAIRCPVLLLRGCDSDLLLDQTAVAMTRRGPPTELVEVDGCGHAPSLMTAEQVNLIDTWLSRTRIN